MQEVESDRAARIALEGFNVSGNGLRSGIDKRVDVGMKPPSRLDKWVGETQT